MNPPISAIRHTWFTTIKQDTRAGLVTFLVAVPLCLGIALASGAPLFSGIIAGILGGIVVGSLSGSSLSVSGPAAGLAVIVFGAIEKLGSFEVFLLAVLLSGILQIMLGFAKAGVISHYFPSAVIKGMLAAIGITLILKQIPHAFGYDKSALGEFSFFQVDHENTFSEILQSLTHIDAGAMLVTVLSLTLLLLWDHTRLKKYVLVQALPAPLLVVLLGIGTNILYRFFFPTFYLSGDHLVSLPVASNMREFASFFTLPDFSQLGNWQVYITAVTIAVVASLETLLNVEATDKLDSLKRNTPPNRELKAQGIGNLIAGFIGGIPLTSVIVRSSVNIQAGAQTKMAAISHGALLLVCVAFIPHILNMIPLACLSAILLITGYKLAKVAIFKEMFGLGKDQFIPFVVTILAVLFTDLLIGLGIGWVVGLFFILKANFKTAYYFHKRVDKEHELIRIDLSENVSFLNKASIINILENLPENATVQVDGSKSVHIDYDVLEVLENYRLTAGLKNIKFEFINTDQRFVPFMVKENDKKQIIPHIHNHEPDYTEYLQLFENNRQWVAEKLGLNPDYFKELAKGQSPSFLFISCSDSRVPASEITGTVPGDMFVHTNVANLVLSTDMNMLSVLQYAIEVLKVRHVIVCGHYGCGGVKAAMGNQDLGLINKWLQNIKDVYRLHKTELDLIENEDDRHKRLVELNVIEQVYNLYKTSLIQKAWQEETGFHVHGWIYDLSEGLLKDLDIDLQSLFKEYNQVYKFDTGAKLPDQTKPAYSHT